MSRSDGLARNELEDQLAAAAASSLDVLREAIKAMPELSDRGREAIRPHVLAWFSSDFAAAATEMVDLDADTLTAFWSVDSAPLATVLANETAEADDLQAAIAIVFKLHARLAWGVLQTVVGEASLATLELRESEVGRMGAATKEQRKKHY